MRNLTHRKRRHKDCGEHRCYLTLEDACHNLLLLEHSQDRIRRTDDLGTNQLNVYRCTNCHEFHVGHIPAPIRHRYRLD